MSAYAVGGIMVSWNVKQSEEFQKWFDGADAVLRADILKNVELIKQMGPALGRPNVDTIKGSSIVNLKELRFKSGHQGNQVIRIFFVFDPDRNAVLLIGGDKAGSGDKTFYNTMIDQSEKIYLQYLEKRKKLIEEEEKKLKKEAEKKKISSKKAAKGKKK